MVVVWRWRDKAAACLGNNGKIAGQARNDEEVYPHNDKAFLDNNRY
ncbi:MAG: hypothetical protein FWG00_02010 [Coriobacteriia bacterium]|nr:hypothetical protein [Coriobacteriia bacterium]